MDSALWSPIATIKAKKYYDVVSKQWAANTGDTAAARKMYENGDILAASHILLVTKGATDEQKTAAKKKAESLRAQANAGNFAALAKANSQDPASAQRGGSLGLFRKGAMVPQFEQALTALKPGEISSVVETEYGYHIIRRPTYDEVKGEVAQAAGGRAMQQAESTFVANLQKNGKVEMRSDAAANARAVLAAPDDHRDDKTVLATSVAGKFTSAELAKWIGTFPPMVVAQQLGQLQNAPDSIVAQFVKNFVTNDLVLRAADSAKVGPTPDELSQLRSSFMQARSAAWTALGIDPKSLADSGKSVADREKLASARIDRYMDRLVAGQAQFVQVAEPVVHTLRDKFKSSINSAGIDRAVERAVKEKVKSDSTRRAGQPSSAVPLPAGPESAPAGSGAQGAPQPAQPTPSKP
jgi:hypothetical protein